MKEKIKLIIVFILGIMISVVISVYAATVISAGEVSYTDNKGIGASNVQDAINGVYTSANSIASRVTALENSLTVQDISYTTTLSQIGCNTHLKYGRIAIISCDGENPSYTMWTNYLIVTLDGVYSDSTVFTPSFNNNGTPVALIQIGKYDNKIYFRPLNASLQNGQFRFELVFITKS